MYAMGKGRGLDDRDKGVAYFARYFAYILISRYLVQLNGGYKNISDCSHHHLAGMIFPFMVHR